MKAVIYGAQGTLGSELERQLRARSYEVFSFDRDDSDVTDADRTKKQLGEIHPDLVFNATGYNNMDKAESEPEAARKLNVDGSAILALICSELDSVLFQFSTGYIFDGDKEAGYNEDEKPEPQSVYAHSKYDGEKKVAELCPKHYIVRLNLLFGSPGASPGSKKTFPDIIQEAVQGKESIDLVTDEISTPTYAKDLAAASIALFEEKYPYGIYHLVNEGRASWYDFAAEVFKVKGVNVKLNPVSSGQLPRPAKRPKFSVIINNKFPKLRSWQDALREYLTQG